MENKAYFTKRGLNKRCVLHEFYHHLFEAKGWEMPNRIEEENARSYAREFWEVDTPNTSACGRVIVKETKISP